VSFLCQGRCLGISECQARYVRRTQFLRRNVCLWEGSAIFSSFCITPQEALTTPRVDNPQRVLDSCCGSFEALRNRENCAWLRERSVCCSWVRQSQVISVVRETAARILIQRTQPTIRPSTSRPYPRSKLPCDAAPLYFPLASFLDVGSMLTAIVGVAAPPSVLWCERRSRKTNRFVSNRRKFFDNSEIQKIF
jgi:hypothetical protein